MTTQYLSLFTVDKHEFAQDHDCQFRSPESSLAYNAYPSGVELQVFHTRVKHGDEIFRSKAYMTHCNGSWSAD